MLWFQAVLLGKAENQTDSPINISWVAVVHKDWVHNDTKHSRV